MDDASLLSTGTAEIGDLPLRSGRILRDARIAYATAGTLAPGRDNVVLVTHGFTSSHLFIGRASPAASEGTWAGLVGPGRAIDTDRFFVVSSNMLGSSFGSTAPASIDPATSRPYGPDFPRLTLSDIVAAQRRMLDGMGIDGLLAVVGPSYGGFQALAWGIDYPDAVRGLSLSVSGLRAPGGIDPEALRMRFATNPNWNGGRHYDHGGITTTMARLREQTMRDYAIDEFLRDRIPDPVARETEIKRQAFAWAEAFDPNSMIALAQATQGFDASQDLRHIKARVQLVLSRTDKLFPPSIAPGVMEAFAQAGVRAEYFELDSRYGHHAAGTDSAKWAPELDRFLRELEQDATAC